MPSSDHIDHRKEKSLQAAKAIRWDSSWRGGLFLCFVQVKCMSHDTEKLLS